MFRVILFILLIVVSTNFAFGVEVWLDCEERVGKIRPLHGVNNGPVNFGETVDLSEYYRELDLPLVRLHDCGWPTPNVVDMHAIFPDLEADPERAENYQFLRTDDYIQAIVNTGAGIVYRLGESIEHTRRKYYVHPPKDFEKWAEVCLGIIRHYNDGWANGFRHNIRYWEIWNEPENRPNMWTGTKEQYYRMYEIAAKKIKAAFPDVKIGGPSIGAPGEVVNGNLKPSDFLQGFLQHCKKKNLPLDFFSWHTYSADPYIYAIRARAIRKLLDEYGYAKAEIHLNEWNYLPDNDWTPISVAGQGLRRQQWYEKQHGPGGAAFTVSTLVDLQDSPVDVANYYRGDASPFGLFTQHGVPKKTFYALKAFRMLLETPQRVKTSPHQSGQPILCAGTNANGTEATVLISYYQGKEQELKLRIQNFVKPAPFSWQLFRLDDQWNLERVRSGQASGETYLTEKIKAPAVLVFRLQRTKE
jgi:xylan 1,4-beta-xylosidase